MKKENITSFKLAELEEFWQKNKNSVPQAHALSDKEVEESAAFDDESVEIYASFFLKPDEVKLLQKDTSKNLYDHFRSAIKQYISSPHS